MIIFFLSTMHPATKEKSSALSTEGAFAAFWITRLRTSLQVRSSINDDHRYHHWLINDERLLTQRLLIVIVTSKLLQHHSKAVPGRPSHLKIPGGPKMARVTLSSPAKGGPCAVMKRPSGATSVCCLAARRAIYGPHRLQLDGPFN